MRWMIMPLRRYADFSGRSRRREYWMWKLFLAGAVLVFWLLMSAVAALVIVPGDPASLSSAGGGMVLIFALFAAFFAFMLVPDLAVTVRRLHDCGRSGWWLAAPLVPYGLALTAVVAGLAAGSPAWAAAGSRVALAGLGAALLLTLLLLAFMLLDGTAGPNRYGPDPKSRSAEGA